ncbi:hypothetical protein CVT25_014584 [Psilocybe cyanescens]|uniref:Uncharacterized protein n=1 Tax=Psilocybe cyanescens TaxID=93625 RepID=A0A409XRD2_PSICY|nr:hypothetical protein CVT25_014584 [Psilocybe cyanescens]
MIRKHPTASSETPMHLPASLIVINNDNAARQLHHAHPLHLAYHRHTLRDGPLRFRDVVVVVRFRAVCAGAGGVVECGRSRTALPVPAPLPVHGYSPSLISPKIKALGDPTQHPWDGMGLGSTRDCKSEERAKDPSDVECRVGLSWSARIKDASCTYAYAMDGKDGFEIYVDPNHVDLDIGEILLVKTSRVALDGVGPRPILPQASSPSPRLVIRHAPISTTPASAFTSSSALTSTAHSNAHLPSSSPSAIATAMSMRPTAPSKMAPMAIEEDEGNMEAGQRLVISQPERAGSVVTMISAYSSNGTRSRSGTLNLTGGSMLASPGAFGSGANDGELGAVACMPAPVHDDGGDVAGDKEEKKKKGKKKSEMGKEKDDGRKKKDGKKEKEGEKENAKA